MVVVKKIPGDSDDSLIRKFSRKVMSELKRSGHNYMASVNILIFVESRYKVNRKKIREALEVHLGEQQVGSDAEISVAIVGDRKMRELSKKYKGEDKTRNVLSFSLTEGETMKNPSNILRLGDVVISYPEVIREAAKEEVLVDEKIEELLIHGTDHLLGLHYD
ncbi:MAG: rRNA maturation RNase YbeY [Candidatus Levybacteria bacterium]|nr:rRNA maturation RNase YbeY [Candidatus Levybacteria bacterium]